MFIFLMKTFYNQIYFLSKMKTSIQLETKDYLELLI